MPKVTCLHRPNRVSQLNALIAQTTIRGTPGGVSIEWYFNFGIASRMGRVHRCGDAFKMQSNARPFRGAYYDNDGNFSIRQVLPIADIVVCREQKLK